MATPATLQARLTEAEEALHRLQIGEQTASVGYDGKSVSYTQANIGALRAYIRELEAALGLKPAARSRAIGVRF